MLRGLIEPGFVCVAGDVRVRFRRVHPFWLIGFPATFGPADDKDGLARLALNQALETAANAWVGGNRWPIPCALHVCMSRDSHCGLIRWKFQSRARATCWFR